MIRVINPTNKEALEWVQAARYYMVEPNHLPYLRVPVMALRLIEESSSRLPTAAVDSSWRMYYNPEFMMRGDIEATAAVIEHELWHLLRKHPERAQARFITRATAKFWNWAADAEIHSDKKLAERIRKTGVDPVTPESLGKLFGGKWESYFVAGLLCEEYYEMIMEAVEEQGDPGDPEPGDDPGGDPGPRDYPGEPGEEEEEGEGEEGQAKPGAGNCGSCATGVPMDWEEPPDDYVDNVQEKIMRKKVAKDIMQSAALGRDVSKGDMAYEWAEEELAPPKINWQTQLRSAVKNAIAFTSGSYEYSRRKLSRRQGLQPDILLPGLQKPIPEIAVVVDASGSMLASFEAGEEFGEETYNLLDQALAETQSIVKKFGMGAGIKVFYTDTTAECAGRIFSPSQMKKVKDKFGGTDIGVGIKAAYQSQPRPQIIVVLTDGGTPWPTNPPPRTKVIIGLVGITADDLKQHHNWKLPDWASKIIEIVN